VEVVEDGPTKKICRATVYLRQIRYTGDYGADGRKARWDLNIAVFGEPWHRQYSFLPGERVDSPSGIHEWTRTFPDVLCDQGRVTIDWDTTVRWVKSDKSGELDNLAWDETHAERHSLQSYPCQLSAPPPRSDLQGGT
jgi:beta-glucanase (GH16 family)